MKTITIEIPESLAMPLSYLMENMNYDEPVTREYLKEELGVEVLAAAEELYTKVIDSLSFASVDMEIEDEDTQEEPEKVKAIPKKA